MSGGMTGNSLLLDTNIVLYFLSGDKTLLPLFEEKELTISVITEPELLGYDQLNDEDITTIEQFLRQCMVINLNDDIKKKTIYMRRTYNIKLPDAIILSTALSLNIPLISADKTFGKIKEGQIILYEN